MVLEIARHASGGGISAVAEGADSGAVSLLLFGVLGELAQGLGWCKWGLPKSMDRRDKLYHPVSARRRLVWLQDWACRGRDGKVESGRVLLNHFRGGDVAVGWSGSPELWRI